MPYEYLASVQSAVRRINDRIKTISNKLGTNSPILQAYESFIDMGLRDNTRFKGDVLQIHTPSDIFNDPDKMKALKKIENKVKTWSEIKTNYESSYEKYLKSDEVEFLGDKTDIETFINVNTELPQALIWMYPTNNDELEKAVEIMHIDGRRKTYDELNEAIKLTRSGKSKAMTEYAKERRYGKSRRFPRVNI